VSSNVTSIAEVRAAARRRNERVMTAHRQVVGLFMIVGGLLLLGLTATISASSTVEIKEEVERFSYLKRQMLGVGLGTIALFVTSRIPYQTYRRHAMTIYLLAVAMLILVLVVGRRTGGATAWLDFGPISFQPSEAAKFAMIVVLAKVMERKTRVLGDWKHFSAPVLALLGTVAILIMLQPDLGTLIIVGAASMAVLLTSTAPLRYVIPLGLGGAAVGVGLAYADPERWSRLTSFLNPWADAGDSGYQVIQSLYALGNGGLFGVGLGASRARWYYLPNAHTDFIFAIIGEEMGLVGAMSVIALCTLLTIVGWSIAARARDPFGKMLAAGIVTWLSLQAVVNIGGVVGALPITGIPLPFVSYGGTAVVISLAVTGVLVNIAQQSGGVKAKS
jgi:cell division protein FtsW